MKQKFFIIKILLCCFFGNIYAENTNNNIETRGIELNIFNLMRKKQWDIALLESKDNPVLHKLVLSQKLIDREYCGNTFAEVQNFIEQNPNWTQIRSLKRSRESLLLKSNEKFAFDWFLNSSTISPEGYAHYADLASEFADEEIKHEIIRKCWHRGAFDENGFKKYLHHKYLTPIDHFKRLDRILIDKDFDKEQAEILITKIAKEKKRSMQIRMLALTEKSDAIKKFKTLSKTQQLDSRNLLAQVIGHGKAEHSNYLAELMALTEKDSSEYSIWAKYRIIYTRELLKHNQHYLAYRIIAKSSKLAEANLVFESQWLAGYIALKYKRNPKLALQHFNYMRSIAGRAVLISKADYWIARAYKAMGNAESAKNFFQKAAKKPCTFYGQIALVELKQDFSLDNDLASPDISAAESLYLIKTAKIFLDNNYPQLAILFANHAIARQKNPNVISGILKYISMYTKDYGVIVEIAKAAAAKGVIIPELSFPRPYDLKNIYVPESLVYSVIRQESSFNVSAYDPNADDAGLMQIIPATGSKIAKSLNIKFDKNKLITDPLYNIKFGSYHLYEWLKYYNGSLPMAIASYNAGSNRVNKWVQWYGDPRKCKNIESVINWLEMITFPGTRGHTQRILENLVIYQSFNKKISYKDIKNNLMGKFFYK